MTYIILPLLLLIIYVTITEQKIRQYRKIYMRVYHLQPNTAPSLLSSVVKRLIDIIISLLVCLTLIPILYVVLGIIIKLTSAGPVIYKQTRVSLFGRGFTCYKFRSMYQNSPQGTTQRDDPRVTPIGKFIRKTHLDEFPQFYNVLSGKMSLVGPRPMTYYIVENELSQYPDYYLRPIIRSGLSGLAQIHSGRLLSRKRFLEYDIEYVKTQSWLKDLKIIMQTLKFADDAY